jgi:hypothetical protein
MNTPGYMVALVGEFAHVHFRLGILTPAAVRVAIQGRLSFPFSEEIGRVDGVTVEQLMASGVVLNSEPSRR